MSWGNSCKKRKAEWRTQSLRDTKPRPWLSVRPDPDPRAEMIHLNVIVMPAGVMWRKSKWRFRVGFISFQCRPLVDSGIKVIKEDQTEFLTIKEPGGIIKCHSMLCSLKIRWDWANSLPALVYNNSHSIRWLDLRSQIFKVQSHLKWLRLRLGGGTHRDRLADHLCLDIVIIVTQLKTQNTTITLLTSPWCIQDYKQPATN